MQILSTSGPSVSTSVDHLAPSTEENQSISASPATHQSLQSSINLTEQLCHYRRRMCRHVASLESAYFGSKTHHNSSKKINKFFRKFLQNTTLK